MLLVKVLSNQLDRRLSSINILSWHIHVVDEQYAVKTFCWSISSLALLDQLRHDQLLNLIRRDLSGERDERWAVFVLWQLHQVVLDVKRLSSSSRANHQERSLILEVKVEEMRVASGVNSRHLNCDTSFNFHVAHQIGPMLPCSFLLEDVNVVENETIWWNGNFDFSNFRRKRRVPNLENANVQNII